MTSPYARPDSPALAELERLLDAVSEELTTWRTRCQKAEQELGQPHTRGKSSSGGGTELQHARHRIGLLEGENQALRQRIALAKEQLEQVKSRLRFVEEHDAGSAA